LANIYSHISVEHGSKDGDDISLLLFNFAIEHTIRGFRQNLGSGVEIKWYL